MLSNLIERRPSLLRPSPPPHRLGPSGAARRDGPVLLGRRRRELPVALQCEVVAAAHHRRPLEVGLDRLLRFALHRPRRDQVVDGAELRRPARRNPVGVRPGTLTHDFKSPSAASLVCSALKLDVVPIYKSAYEATNIIKSAWK